MSDRLVWLPEPLPADFDPMTQALLLRHDLSCQEGFDLDALVSLADALPSGSLEASPLGAGPLAPDGLEHIGQFVDSDAGGFVRSLQGQGRSLYFYNIERVEQYRDVVTAVLEDMVDDLGVDRSDMGEPEGYVFLSGGVTTTSAHLDHECNLLLVLEGSKRVYLAATVDDSVHRALERMHSGGYGTTDRLPEAMECFELGPGDGVYIPPLAVHYVENGADPCTALSVVYRHRRTADEVPVYAINARIRRLGLVPKPPGGPFDSMKRRLFVLGRALQPVRKRLRGVDAT